MGAACDSKFWSLFIVSVPLVGLGCLSGPVITAISTVILLGGVWLAYRVVNWPRFADFLIAVEAEMAKVSWPSRQALYRHSVVVIAVIFILVFLLFAFDSIWQLVFRSIGVLRT